MGYGEIFKYFKINKIMVENDIIKIVEELVDKELFAMYPIYGKKEFFSKLKDKLKILFDENDLTK